MASGKQVSEDNDWWNCGEEEDEDDERLNLSDQQRALEERSEAAENVNDDWSAEKEDESLDESTFKVEEEQDQDTRKEPDLPVNLIIPVFHRELPKLPKFIKDKIDFSKRRIWKPISTATHGSYQDDKPHRIRVLGWNIEGLNPEKLKEKTLGLCENIRRDDPHVILLQEVLKETQEILIKELPMYYFIPSNKCSYYNLGLVAKSNYYIAIMVKKEPTVIHECKVISFPTYMGRNLLSVKCTIKEEKFILMTSHLESMGIPEIAAVRKKQLKKAFRLMLEAEIDHTVIFGGDLNLRDHELQEIGGIPADIYDVWEITGRRPDAQFTWDMQCNDNLVFSSSNGNIRPRKRFDRLYLRYSFPVTVEPVYFELIGFDRLPCGKFVSDHWGLLTHLDILSKLPRKGKDTKNNKRGRHRDD